MKHSRKFAALLSVSGALLMSGVAFAQAPAAPPPDPAMAAPGAEAPGGAGGGAGDLGAVTNETTTTETTTTTTGVDMGADSTLPNTGGEPLTMAMLGSLAAGSALLLRRKLC